MGEGEQQGESFVVRPQDFVSGPYETCPFCGAEESFGRLSVYGRHYIKRCNECMETKSFDLPELSKRVVYLDQNAVSHLAKCLHPDFRAKYQLGNPVTQDGFWREAFARLDRLQSLQLLVCPESPVHRTESLLDSRLTQPLRTLYEHLSGEVDFYSTDQIRQFQISRCFSAWLAGEDPDYVDRDLALRGRLDGWLDTLRISVNLGLEDWEAAEAKSLRERRDLQPVYDRVAGEPALDFEAYFEREMSSAPGLVSGWDAQASMRRCLERDGIPSNEWESKAQAFAGSAALRTMPVMEIWAAMLAAWFVQISSGRAAKPTRGMYFDLIGISSFLPYCDAMFIDRECNRFLQTAREHGKIGWPTAIFTIDSRDEFMAYLEEIEANAPVGHEELVIHVYGESALEPFWTLYEWRDQ